MSFLQRLRGRGAAAVDPILPVLKAPNWPATDALRRPWTDLGHPDVVPWLAFGRDRPTLIEFVNARDMGDRPLAEIEAEAIRNLRSFRCSWIAVDTTVVGSPPMTVLLASGPYAAEHVLVESFMAEAHDRLRSPLIAVGVPARNTLVAIGPPKGRHFAAFDGLVRRYNREAQGARISAGVFLMEGTKVFAAPADARAQAPLAAPSTTAAASVACTRSTAPAAGAGGDLVDVVLAIGRGAGTFADAMNAIRREAVLAFDDARWNPAFAGGIRVLVDPDEVPDAATPDAARAFARESEDLTRSLRALDRTAISGQPITLTIGLGRGYHSPRR
jgi:hypothetical protein